MADLKNDIKLLSANCRGLNNKEKLFDVINYMKSSMAQIVCLQDTHLRDINESEVKKIWDGECILHGSRGNARGGSNFAKYKL